MNEGISQLIDPLVIVLFKIAAFLYFFVIVKCVQDYCVIF